MPRKEKEGLQGYMSSLMAKMENLGNDLVQREVPSILKFVEDKEFLGLPFHDPPIKLFTMQRLILKCFYRGSPGNTGPDMEFTDAEINYLRKCGLDTDDRGNVVDKITNGNVFRELILVWGRRSGKDFISSIIALYEVMRLLETPGGDPYAVYRLQRGGNPICILTIANSASQAGIAFAEMKAKLLSAPYFEGKYTKEGITSSAIYLQTPQDRRDNEKRRKEGMPEEKGSVMLRAGHSNSDSLLGIQCFVLLLDEVASFKNTSGSSGGSRIYEAMLPSLGTFVRDEIIYDENGNTIPDLDEDGNEQIDPRTGETKIKVTKVFDSKVVSISSPRGKEGILWDMFKDASTVANRLVCRLPTWVVNEKYTKESLRKTVPNFNDERFMMEFGADFSGTAGSNFFIEENVLSCFQNGSKEFVDRGTAGHVYFAHLDPASTGSNRYALAVCHKEIFNEPTTGQTNFKIVLDHLKTWVPQKGKPIVIDEIDRYVLWLNQNFHIGLVTYDDHHSLASVQRLQRAGIPCRMTKNVSSYKVLVYAELEQLVNENRLCLPFDGDEANNLYNEMINLQRRYNTGRGYAVFPNRECETPTDDACDALACAAYNCITRNQTKLPTSRLVAMPTTQAGGARPMNSMQGTPYSPRVMDHMRAKMGNGRFLTPQPRPGY